MRPRQLIQTRALTKLYGETIGIDSLYLDVAEGETFGLFGYDGAGKTTIISLLLGLIQPTYGEADVLGFDTLKDSYLIRSHSGCIPGNFNFYGGLTGEDFLNMCAKTRNKGSERRTELVERLGVDTSTHFDAYASGDRQKLALVQALMHDPPLLILDNPLGGLDHPSREAFTEILMEERNRGKTILLSTNSPAEIVRLCDRVGLLREGELIEAKAMDELKDLLGRRVRITFREKVDLEDIITEDVRFVSHDGLEWVLAVRREMGSLIRRIGQRRVADVVYLDDAVEQALIEMLKGEPQPMLL